MSQLNSNKNSTLYFLILIFIILAAGIITTGYLYYRNYEKHYRTQVEQQLSTIADLKVGEILQWRKERLGDAAILSSNPLLSALVRHFFENPGDATAQRQLQVWLGSYSHHFQSDHIRLLDSQGVTRMSLPAKLTPASATVLQHIPEVLRSRQQVMIDFYFCNDCQKIHLAVLVPLLDETVDKREIGIIVLYIDPQIYLYPLINHWPSPSLTGETLLVRRDGNDVLFLNELKFKKNTALTLRISLGNKDLPATKAVLGQEGIVEGKDYRGVSVFACLRRVTDSPWFLVSRIDTAEVFAPLRERLWEICIMVVVLLFGTGLGVALVWRQQRVLFYRERYKAAVALQESEGQFRDLFESINDAVFVQYIEGDSSSGYFAQVNDMACQSLGYTKEELLGLPPQAITTPAEHKKLLDRREQLMSKGNIVVETIHVTRDGRQIPVESNVRIFNLFGKRAAISIARDITERKQAEEALVQLNRRIELILNSAGEGILGLNIQGKHTFLNPAAARMLGYEPQELIGIPSHITWHHTKPDGSPYPVEECPIYSAYRDGNVRHVATEVFWRKDGTSFPVEYTSTPIISNGEISGAVVTFSDISELKRIEEDLIASKDYLENIINSSWDAIVISNNAGRITKCNRYFMNLVGYNEDEVIGRYVYDFSPTAEGTHESSAGETVTIDEAFFKQAREAIATMIENGNVANWQTYLISKSQKIIPVEENIVLLFDNAGNRIGSVGTLRDITERRRTENERDRLIAELQKALVHIKTLRGIVPICSSCKKIRDDQGYWNQVEVYVSEHTEADFTHSICPDCTQKLYPEIYVEMCKDKK